MPKSVYGRADKGINTVSNQIFADGVGSISVIGGTVRLDLFSFSPTEKDANGQPKAISDHRLVMTVPAFLHAAAKIQEAGQAIGKLGPAGAPMPPSDDAGGAPPKKASKPPFP